MELRRYASLALKWLWLLVLGTLIAGGAVYQVSRSQPRAYRASLTLLVNQAQSSNGPDYSSLMASEYLTRTYAQLITSSRMLDAAYQRLGLGEEEQTSSASAQVVRDTQLVILSAEDESPQRARDVATAIAEVFVERQVADQVAQTAVPQKVLREQIVDLDQRMRETSQAIEVAKAGGDAKAGELQRLQGVLSQYQVTHAELVRSESDIQLANARFANAIRVVEPAELPIVPIRPKVLQNTLLAAILGLLASLGLALLLEHLDDTVKTEEDAALAIGLPTLAAIPLFRNANGDWPLLSGHASARHLTETFRRLRLNCDLAWAGEPGQVIMVTSASPLEGKTTTTANLAMSFAQDNRRVVVIDADLRSPSLHDAFDLDSREGLSSLLADPSLTAASRLRATRVPNLRLLPAGPTPPNSPELLGSIRFSSVISELRQEADVILIDTPPLLDTIDPAVVGKAVDGAIVVVAAGQTRMPALGKAMEILERGATRGLGVVLNETRKGQSHHAHSWYRQRALYDSISTGDGHPSERRWGAEVARPR